MFDFRSIYMADDVPDAIAALEREPGARIIAGGTDLLLEIRSGRAPDTALVCIRGIDELSGVDISPDGDISIKPLCSFTDIIRNPIIKEYLPVLAQAAGQVGGPQIRNIGTIGGNICNGATCADTGATLLAYNASVIIEGKTEVRAIPLSEFYISAGKVDLGQSEIVTEIIIKKQDYTGYTGRYIKYAMRNAMDIATIACAAICRYDPASNVLEDVRLAFGTAAPAPMRCYGAEDALKGMEVSERMFEILEDCVASEISPRSSWRASKELRLRVALEICRRAVEQGIHNGQ